MKESLEFLEDIFLEKWEHERVLFMSIFVALIYIFMCVIRYSSIEMVRLSSKIKGHLVRLLKSQKLFLKLISSFEYVRIIL